MVTGPSLTYSSCLTAAEKYPEVINLKGYATLGI